MVVCRFNRGSLINVGFLQTESTFDYIAIHDVDLVPENQNISYSFPHMGPYHASAPELHPKYHYEKFLGGILLINREHFRMVSVLVCIHLHCALFLTVSVLYIGLTLSYLVCCCFLFFYKNLK